MEICRPIVLVHGGMHGAWCWKRVQPLLWTAGHYVVAPTLTGLGHRAHLGGRDVNLSRHINDIVSCIVSEELNDVILVGHSYAGMVITGVADHLRERISTLVYLDALVPKNGECASDLVSRDGDFSSFADGMLPFIEGYDFGLTNPEDKAWVQRRLTHQSVATVIERLHLQTDLSDLRRVFIECTQQRAGQPQMLAIAAIAGQLSSDPTWRMYKLAAGHDCMISHPEETASLLLAIAREPT